MRPLHAQPLDVVVPPPEQPASSPIIERAPSESPTNTITGKRLSCSNVSFGIEEKTILEAFSKYGTVKKILLPTRGKNTRTWEKDYYGGFCFVTFDFVEEAEAALKGLNGTELAGRVVNVQYRGSRKSPTSKSLLDAISKPGPLFREALPVGDEEYVSARENLSTRDEEYVCTQPLVTGTVSRIGTMLRTVAVTTTRRYLDAYTKTHHLKEETVLLHDHDGILAEGDVVKYQHLPPDLHEKRLAEGQTNVKHVLREVVTPFGIPVAERTPTLSTRPNPDKIVNKSRRRRELNPVAG